MKRAFLIKNNLNLHGPTKVLEESTLALKEMGYSPLVISFKGGESAARLYKNEIPVKILFSSQHLKNYFSLLKLIYHYSPEIIHTFSWKPAFFISSIPFLKAKKIFSFFGYGKEKFLNLLFDTTIISASNYHRNLILKNGGPPTKVLYCSFKEEKKHSLNFSPLKEVKLGTIGRNLEIKGFPYFFLLIKILKEKYKISEIKGYILGTELNSSWKDKIKKINLEGNILFEGIQTSSYQFLRKIDFYVQTSLSETYGLSLLEAMQMGIPSFSFKNGGAEEIIGKNEGGILVEKKDVEKLAHQIYLAYRNIDYYHELSWSAQQRFKTKFNWNNFKKEYLKIILENDY